MFCIPTVHVKLPDIIDTEFFFLKLDLVGFGSKFRGKVPNVIWERGGEKNDLDTGPRKEAEFKSQLSDFMERGTGVVYFFTRRV